MVQENSRVQESSSLRPFVWRVLIVIGIAALVFVLWRIMPALLLVFAAILFAILLLRLTGMLRNWVGWSHGWALTAVIVGLIVLVGLLGLLLGAQISGQFGRLAPLLTEGVEKLPEGFRNQFFQGGWMSELTSIASAVTTFLAYFLFVLFAAVYIAASPDTYRQGILLLVPPARQERARQVLDECGHAIWLWLIGQFISMISVAILTTLGLWLIGMPSALALGVIAGVLEFIPIVGPWLAAIPALLLAIGQGWTQVAYVAAVYLVIQQLESNLILPLAERRAVTVPPVVTLTAVVAAGLLFGFLGVFVATPLAIVLMVVVDMVYVEDTLGQGRHFPGR